MFRRITRRLSLPLKTIEIGERFEPGWKLYFECEGQKKISPWHSIPLLGAANVFNYVNEIPKGTREKLEIATKVPSNPIMQDKFKKTGLLRCFTYGDIPFNYGCLPQTWEDPSVTDKHTQCVGDGDPVDVVELSDQSLNVGEVISVRVLGVLALIDEGETDWKLLTVRVDSGVKSLADISSSKMDEVRHWFRYYKTTDGKPENKFAFDGNVQKEDFALQVVSETSAQYQALLRKFNDSKFCK